MPRMSALFALLERSTDATGWWCTLDATERQAVTSLGGSRAFLQGKIDAAAAYIWPIRPHLKSRSARFYWVYCTVHTAHTKKGVNAVGAQARCCICV